VAPSPLRERLETTFRFDRADLDANRSGRLSPRQVERMRAATSAARLALAVFAVVTIGSGLLVARSVAPDHVRWSMGAAAAVAAIGWAISRASLAALGRREVSVAEGLAAADSRGRLVLGATKLELAATGQLEAFEPGDAYRVYYVAGPRALVLSAEALDERAEPGPAASSAADPAQDAVVAVARRARWIVVAIGAMVVEIPAVMILADDLPRGARLAIFLALLAQGIGFAVFALRWLGRRR
jgi:hypothetical protein